MEPAFLECGAPDVMNLGIGNAVWVFIDSIDDWLCSAQPVLGEPEKLH